VEELVALDGAKHIEAEELLGLLQHALDLRQMQSVGRLLQLPSTAEFRAADVEALLLRCVQLEWPLRSDWYDPEANATCIVSSLGTVQKLDAAALLRLLQAAVAHGDKLVLPLLVQQPMAANIAAADVAALLEAAVLRNDVRLVQQLCQLAGAQVLEASALLQLLQAAVSCRRVSFDGVSDTGFFLLQLPGARQLSADSLQALLLVASGVRWQGMRSATAVALEGLLIECRRRWQM
jgi:hypothetical protein